MDESFNRWLVRWKLCRWEWSPKLAFKVQSLVLFFFWRIHTTKPLATVLVSSRFTEDWILKQLWRMKRCSVVVQNASGGSKLGLWCFVLRSSIAALQSTVTTFNNVVWELSMVASQSDQDICCQSFFLWGWDWWFRPSNVAQRAWVFSILLPVDECVMWPQLYSNFWIWEGWFGCGNSNPRLVRLSKHLSTIDLWEIKFLGNLELLWI